MLWWYTYFAHWFSIIILQILEYEAEPQANRQNQCKRKQRGSWVAGDTEGRTTIPNVH